MSDEAVSYESQISNICDLCGSEDGYHLPICPLHPDWDNTTYVDADEFYVDPLFDFDSELEG